MEAALDSMAEHDCEIVDYPVKTAGRPKRFHLLRGNDHVTSQMKLARPWEYDLLNTIYSMTARGGSFVEVGANVGTDTVLASDFFRNCYAFEPVERNAEILRRNVELNNLHNVRVFQKAVSNRCGTAKLFAPVGNNCGTASLRAVEAGTEGHFTEIETVTLDSALPNVRDVTFIHIDAQGHDLKVLQGAREFLGRQLARPYIRMEFQPATMRAHGSHVSELIEFIEEFQYSPVTNASGAMAPLSPGILIDMFYLWKKSKGWIDLYLAPE
jgi:FkbM family methyltransferase